MSPTCNTVLALLRQCWRQANRVYPGTEHADFQQECDGSVSVVKALAMQARRHPCGCTMALDEIHGRWATVVCVIGFELDACRTMFVQRRGDVFSVARHWAYWLWHAGLVRPAEQADLIAARAKRDGPKPVKDSCAPLRRALQLRGTRCGSSLSNRGSATPKVHASASRPRPPTNLSGWASPGSASLLTLHETAPSLPTVIP